MRGIGPEPRLPSGALGGVVARAALGTAGAVGGVALLVAAALSVATLRWRRETARAVAELRAGAAAAAPRADAEPRPLPAPVARYLAFAAPEELPARRLARVEWVGEFRAAPGARWSPFTATQHFTTLPPGFVWDAEIRMLPLLPVRVRDSYRARGAQMLGRVGGLLPVVDEGGSPEIAQSALARWLGEAVWFPTAFRPGGAVRWEAVNDRTARATVTDGPVSASADFHFGPGGEIAAMTAMRFRDVDGVPVLTRFEGRYGEYVRRAGVMVPGSAEVAWLLPEGRHAYWRARPSRIVTSW